MLAAVSKVVDDVLAALTMLGCKHGVTEEVMLPAHTFPERVCAAAVISGLYNDSKISDLAQTTADIPMLVWLTDTTPHESLRVEQDTYRKYLRLVSQMSILNLKRNSDC